MVEYIGPRFINKEPSDGSIPYQNVAQGQQIVAMSTGFLGGRGISPRPGQAPFTPLQKT